MTDIQQEVIDRLQRLVYDSSDLHFTPQKQAFFARKLLELSGMCGMDDIASYCEYIEKTPEELERLVQALTVNTTYFFRNPGQFKSLLNDVLPGLIEAKNLSVAGSWSETPEWRGFGHPHKDMNIRILSAGCSTGEEAYSIAFAVQESLKFINAWDVEIIGTDLSRQALTVACKGEYTGESIGEAMPDICGKYLKGQGDVFTVGPESRRLVKFCAANLKELAMSTPRRLRLHPLEGAPTLLEAQGYFDVIFCRNVMIYFDRRGQQRLVDALYDCIRPGGYLFTGDSEPLHLFNHRFVRECSEDVLYYRRPQADHETGSKA